MTRNDNEWHKKCKYNKEHLPTHAILIGSKSCVCGHYICANAHILRTNKTYIGMEICMELWKYGANNVQSGYIMKILEGKYNNGFSKYFQYIP